MRSLPCPFLIEAKVNASEDACVVDVVRDLLESKVCAGAACFTQAGKSNSRLAN